MHQLAKVRNTPAHCRELELAAVFEAYGAMNLATPLKLAREWGMMSIPFEEFEQSSSRTCQVIASAVDASCFLLGENQTPRTQNPRFLSKPGVLFTSNLAVKERFETTRQVTMIMKAIRLQGL
ncbi:hypothetical protein [Pseudomonas sp. GM74]|uniref:hypothetical protein n=1 Tax=Pseudomonas sp. GM74 TaxID=1144336 RepID=UPI0012FCC4E7|nr:hypothetical protein [Pseudomonas sp. GM74]